MVTVLVKLHGLLYRGLWWLLQLPLRALWATFLAVLALMGEEFRRWAGLAVIGVLLVGAGKGVLNWAPAGAQEPLLLVVLFLLGIWALAVRRAGYLTKSNNLRAVRQRQAFRELKGEVNNLPGQINEQLARRTQGSRTGRLFKANRDADAAEAARVEAEQRAADAAAAEQAARDAWLESLPPDHDPYATMGGR